MAGVRPATYPRHVWGGRASRLWKRYLRFAAVIAAVFGTVMLTLQYFVLVPPFAWLARRAGKREPAGWVPIPRERAETSTSLYWDDHPRHLGPLPRFGRRARGRRRAGVRRPRSSPVPAPDRRELSRVRQRVETGSA